MLDSLSVLWMTMPAIDTINPQSNKLVTCENQDNG